MTVGIYKLDFQHEGAIYIGQSRNIEERYLQHIYSFNSRAASKKLQSAFDQHGRPALVILLECDDDDDMDQLENCAIELYDSVSNGLNTKYSSRGDYISLYGELNGRAKYSNSQIIEVMNLLILPNSLSLKKISQLTGVGIGMVRDISCCNSHRWLEREFPSEYAQLKALVGKRSSRYYKKIKSPTGDIHTVENLSNFCRKYNLDTGNVSRLLRGIRRSYNGWKLVED